MKNLTLLTIFLVAFCLCRHGVQTIAALPTFGIHPHLSLHISAEGHPCGIFHPRQRQTFTIAIANDTGTPWLLRGNLRWQFCSSQPCEHWHTLLAVPIAPAMVGAASRVMLHFPLRFNKVGFYRLIYHHRDIAAAAGPVLECIYRPAGTIIPTPLSPWIRNLPRSFIKPHPLDYVGDYIRQTSIRRYVLRLQWPQNRIHTAPRQPAITPAQLQKVAQSLARHQAVMVLAVQLGPHLPLPTTGLRRFQNFLAPWLGATGTDLTALAIIPPGGPPPAQARRLIGQLCLEGLRMARIINPRVQFMSSPELFSPGFSSPSFSAGQPVAIINMLALPSRQDAFRRYLGWLTRKTPVWVLPPCSRRHRPLHASPSAAVAPALALAQGAAVVPTPRYDFGLLEHLLGGAALFHIVHPHLPPFIAAFQGNHGCVAVIAGLGAPTMRNQQWSALRYWPVHRVPSAAGLPKTKANQHAAGVKRRGKSSVSYPKSFSTTRAATNGPHRTGPGAASPMGYPTGTLVVLDPAHDMQATTSRGRPLTSPIAGWHEIPLNCHTYYLTSTGSVGNLVAALRTATIEGLPPVALAAFLNPNRPTGLMVVLRNGRLGHLRGSIRVKVATAAFSPWRKFLPIPSGHSAIIGPFHLPNPAPAHTTFVIQVKRAGVIWQTAGSITSRFPTPPPAIPTLHPTAIPKSPATQPFPTAPRVPGVYHLRMPIIKSSAGASN